MNALVKLLNRNLIFSVERTTQISSLPRFLSYTNAVGKESKSSEILRKLNIPERPKRPLTGYIRFLNEFRSSYQNTATSPKEVVTLAGAEWKKLDDGQKQKYNKEYKMEKDVYAKKVEAYEKRLTKDQKLAIKDERIRLNDLKEYRMKQQDIKNRAKENGKPKRPANDFLLFLSDEASKGKTTSKLAKVKFDALSESQRSAYKQKANVLLDEYKKSLAVWEKQMISKGLTELVKKSAVRLAKRK